MRLVEARVKNCRIIRDPVEVSFEDGLNVLHGPNEVGKSSFLRALWLGLTARPRTTSQDVTDLRPHAGGHTEVRVVFEENGTRYTIDKHFTGQSGTANLRIDGSGRQETVEGDEVDERLRQVLGLGPNQARGPNPESYGYWPLVWVWQGEDREPPTDDLENDGRDALSSNLGEVEEGLLAGSGSGDLLGRVEEEYERFWTPTGRESSSSDSPLAQARAELDEAQQEQRRLENRRDEYERTVDRFQLLQERRESLGDDLPEKRRELEAAKKRLREIKEVRKDFEVKEARLAEARVELERVRELAKEREELREEISEHEQAIEELEETVAKREKDLQELEEVAPTGGPTRELRSAIDETERRRRRLQAHSDLLQSSRERENVEEQVEKVEAEREELEELQEDLAKAHVRPEDLSSLESLHDQRRKAQEKLERAAAALEVTALEPVRVGQEGETRDLQPDETLDLVVDSPTVLQIGEVAEVRVVPGGRELTDIRSDVRDAEERWVEGLADHGVESLDEAREIVDERNRIQGAIREKESRLEAWAPDGVEALRKRLVELEGAEAKARKRLESVTQPDDEPLPDDRDEVSEELESVQNEVEELKDELREKEEEASATEATRRDLDRRLQRKETLLEEERKALQRSKKNLERHLDEHGSDDRLEDTVKEKRATYEKLEAEQEELEQKLAELQPEAAEEELDRARETLSESEEEADELQEKLIEARTRLSAPELAGLHDRLAEAAEACEEAQQVVDRLVQRAEAVKLLRDTLRSHRRRAREAYLAPLRREVEGLAGLVFPNAEVHFTERFEVATLGRGRDRQDPFEDLSQGAREQLALLVRLGMARILADDGTLPVVLDDVLTYSDPDRFRKMTHALRRLARDLQIILVTCHWDRYRDLGKVHEVDFERLRLEGTS